MENGGVVALAYYEHGAHFLNVEKKGRIERKGYFLPAAGSTSSAYWITRDIIYAVETSCATPAPERAASSPAPTTVA